MITADPIEFSKHVDDFLNCFGKQSTFPDLDKKDLREKVWATLFYHLKHEMDNSLRLRYLAVLTVLSRERKELDELLTMEYMETVLKCANLLAVQNLSQNESNVTRGALSLLSNLLYNSGKARRLMLDTHCLSALVACVDPNKKTMNFSVQYSNLIILFLITAYEVPVRRILKVEHKLDTYLMKILEDYCTTDVNEELVSESGVELVCQILKVLFNLYIHVDETEEREKRICLVGILRRLLTKKPADKATELYSNVVNLLTVIPEDCYSAFIPTADGLACYRNVDISAVSTLLEFLKEKLQCTADLLENVTPILTVLIKLVNAEKLARKFVRQQVLPPLKDVAKRPEEGDSMRARLCKLLTCPLIEVRDLAAEFLFVLCKENVSRMVKYTGYGNAAGMFANKGLLGRERTTTTYSSDSEDSETEEYSKYKERINPVTGCYEDPKPNVLEGMTEEQKEYEALKLVELVDKLSRSGIVHPCRIGEDGKPKPVAHVLELQEELPKQQYQRRDSNSD
ncbi:hypothetical protein KM043_014333 [Ampulex compressa]|nr:hypothetical protein KM043_014333 [Ampulex compressa]